MRRLTKAQFVERARDKHGDAYDYDEAEYVDSKTNVVIRCGKCRAVFQQTPSNHLGGKGCSVCSGGVRLTKPQFLSRAVAVHGHTYDYSLVNYVRSQTKVQILCPKHGSFEQTPNSHLNGCGCPTCANEGRRTSTAEFIRKSRENFGDRFDYSLTEYENVDSSILVRCNLHDRVFAVMPWTHLRGKGCPECWGRRTKSSFISQATEVHGNVYDYSAMSDHPESGFLDHKTPIQIACTRCSLTFPQRPDNHLQGQGCPVCSGGVRLTKPQFLSRAVAVHGHTYDYSLVNYVRSQTKVQILCPKHGSFEQTPNSHLNGCGCPTCKESQGERRTARLLEQLNVSYERQKILPGCRNKKPLPFDFWLPQFNALVEIQGGQHTDVRHPFYDPEVPKRDHIKSLYAREFNFITIHWEREDLEATLREKLCSLLI